MNRIGRQTPFVYINCMEKEDREEKRIPNQLTSNLQCYTILQAKCEKDWAY